MESFGKHLKAERERRGVSLEEISRVTKISPGQLKALENDDFATLPPITFVKGFARAYAKHLGIDPDETMLRLEQFLSEIEGEEDSFGEKATRQFRRAAPDPKIIIAAGGLLLLFLILLLVIAIRGCGKPDAAIKTTQSPISSVSASENLDSYLSNRSNSTGELAKPILPMVPPQSFRVTKSARPQGAVAQNRKSELSEELPGGGTGEQSP